MPEPTNQTSYQKPYNLEPNVEAALSYLIPPFTGIAVIAMEKTNKFVRFHAMQSILFGVASFILWSIASTLTTILVGFLLLPLISIGCIAVWIFLMWKAYNNDEWKLPYLGEIAKKQVNKS